ncbi:MAG: transglutaminase family protein [Candidatus Methylumidiphilus sp.]
MSTRIALTHRIDLQFNQPVQVSTHWLRLRPAPHCKAFIEAYSLKIEAEPNFLNWVRDPYENYLARLDLPEPLSSLGMTVEVIAKLIPANPFNFLVEPYAFKFPFEYPAHLTKELAPYLRVGDAGPRLAAWLASLKLKPGYIVERLGELNLLVNKSFPDRHETSPAMVDLEAMLQSRLASSGDLAWLLTLSLRRLGLAARFTSGYLVMLATPEGGLDRAKMHAWSEVYLPGAGWVGLDPGVGIFTAEGHIPLASAPEPLRTLPMVGYFEACREIQKEEIVLRRLVPQPVSQPYGESTWADMRALGGKIDAALKAESVNLSLGLDIAFVSSQYSTDPEWATATLGPNKRQAAADLLARLRNRIAPGGVLHVGQSDWYDGEAMPRWRLGCFFRADGAPIWHNKGLLGVRHASFPIDPSDARRFAELLADELGISASLVLCAHEDGLYQLWVNRGIFDYTPPAEDVTEPVRRKALAELLSANQGEPVGFVLPLRWDDAKSCWSSGSWKFRRNGLYLTPGEFPMGYRLPLESLQVGELGAVEPDPDRCPFEERPILAKVCGELSARFSSFKPAPVAEYEAADTQPSNSLRPPRTACCVQVRQGQLFVFLPPLTHLEHYLDLISAIETTATKTGIPVMFEGYEPPEDYRLRRLIVEPEPGTLKLSLPEAHDFAQQHPLLLAAYAEAENTGLRAERVLPDGKREPPGGRAEMRLGGAMPMESPFLRTPELLRSLIVYWQRHPCLSYFFAGRSIGPGGAAPRPDEGRDDALYELATALHRFPTGENPMPWVADRLLRHLLADSAGDVKRAEIRIDRLYPPERSSLRLGRILIRSFETPPDARMAGLQSLLVTGILAHLAQTPTSAELVDWRSALHDRFMLPRVLWGDLKAVLDDLGAAGYPFQLEWFQPFLDLRFPLLGKVQTGDIGLELRHAHEPWPVLAEETTASGIARFVDSANTKVEIKCTGLSPSRYALVCNGRRLPLHETGVAGEVVGGVRFKAFNPPATLHPTKLPVNALVFDLVDIWTGRVVAGCTYFPPRAPVFGPVGPVPVSTLKGGEGQVSDRLPSVPVTFPTTGGGGGAFVAKGSGVKYLNPPPVSLDMRFPFLLDLARLD